MQFWGRDETDIIEVCDMIGLEHKLERDVIEVYVMLCIRHDIHDNWLV